MLLFMGTNLGSLNKSFNNKLQAGLRVGLIWLLCCPFFWNDIIILVNEIYGIFNLVQLSGFHFKVFKPYLLSCWLMSLKLRMHRFSEIYLTTESSLAPTFNSLAKTFHFLS